MFNNWLSGFFFLYTRGSGDIGLWLVTGIIIFLVMVVISSLTSLMIYLIGQYAVQKRGGYRGTLLGSLLGLVPGFIYWLIMYIYSQSAGVIPDIARFYFFLLPFIIPGGIIGFYLSYKKAVKNEPDHGETGEKTNGYVEKQ